MDVSAVHKLKYHTCGTLYFFFDPLILIDPFPKVYEIYTLISIHTIILIDLKIFLNIHT